MRGRLLQAHIEREHLLLIIPPAAKEVEVYCIRYCHPICKTSQQNDQPWPPLHGVQTVVAAQAARAAQAVEVAEAAKALRGDGREGAGPAAGHHKTLPSRLSFSNNHIGNKGVMRVAQLLYGGPAPHGHPGLWPPRTLDLTHNSVGDEGASALAAALMRDDAVPVSELTLWHNDIGANGAAALAKLIAKPTFSLTKTLAGSIPAGNEGILFTAFFTSSITV